MRTSGRTGATAVCQATENDASCLPLAAYDGDGIVDGVGPFSNICVTLSTATSLAFKLGAVEAGEALDGCEWNKDFLARIRRAQGHTSTGTPRDNTADGYEAFGVSCGDWVTMPEDSEAWCDDLVAENRKKDCHLRVAGPQRTGRWGHQMQIHSASRAAGNGCSVNVVDTMLQGKSGNGDDVPVIPAHQQWLVYWNGANPTGGVVGGDVPASRTQLNALTVDTVEYLCCGPLE